MKPSPDTPPSPSHQPQGSPELSAEPIQTSPTQIEVLLTQLVESLTTIDQRLEEIEDQLDEIGQAFLTDDPD